MQTITIDVGVHTFLEVDLTTFDFTGVEKVIMTVKNFIGSDQPVICERVFTTPEIHTIVITPEESKKLRNGAQFDFDRVLINGIQEKLEDNGTIILRWGCGQCHETQ